MPLAATDLLRHILDETRYLASVSVDLDKAHSCEMKPSSVQSCEVSRLSGKPQRSCLRMFELVRLRSNGARSQACVIA